MSLATGFLTILPVPAVPHIPGELGRAGFWFPWVGLLVGGLLWLANSAANLLFAPFPAAVLVVAVWAALTGALHLDGLADCCDGLLPPVDKDRRLEILRDPHMGAFGVVGLVLFLVAKIGAVAELGNAWPALVLGPVWARWLLLWAARAPAARPGGMGAAFGAGLSLPVVLWAGLLPGLLLFSPGWSWQSGIGAGLAVLFALGAVAFARARLGGVTGDVLGLVVEGCELAVLLAFAYG